MDADTEAAVPIRVTGWDDLISHATRREDGVWEFPAGVYECNNVSQPDGDRNVQITSGGLTKSVGGAMLIGPVRVIAGTVHVEGAVRPPGELVTYEDTAGKFHMEITSEGYPSPEQNSEDQTPQPET